MTEQTTLSIQDGVSALLGTPKASETPAEEPKQATPEPEEPDTEEPGGAEPEEEDDAGDEEADAPSDDEPTEPEYEVELDGEVRKVRHKELVDGWRRGQHYESKVERLRQKEAAVEQELTAATQTRTRYADQLSALEQALSSEDPDLQELKKADPSRYLIIKSEREEALKKVQEERRKVAAEQQQHEQALIRQRIETERAKLYALLPSWRDPKKAAADKAREAAEGYRDLAHRQAMLHASQMQFQAMQNVMRMQMETARIMASNMGGNTRWVYRW